MAGDKREKVNVDVAFEKVDGNRIGFKLGTYDKDHPLIIDPTYEWHTFYGSGSEDLSNCIAMDGSGNLYVTGWSAATWRGPNNEDPLHDHSGDKDIVVLKLNRSGVYQWHTFLGSTNIDVGKGIAVDSWGNVYVTGFSEATRYGPSGQQPLHAHNGNYDIVVLKLNADGQYQWHTFYGSTQAAPWNESDDGNNIAVDAQHNNVYVVGQSWATWNGPSGQQPLHAHSGYYDIVILKLNTNGEYQWHTFYGSSYDDGVGSITVDTSGNVYATGRRDVVPFFS